MVIKNLSSVTRARPRGKRQSGRGITQPRACLFCLQLYTIMANGKPIKTPQLQKRGRQNKHDKTEIGLFLQIRARLSTIKSERDERESSSEADILKMGILVCVPLPTFRHPTSQSKMSSLEIFPHPTCEVKGSGD